MKNPPNAAWIVDVTIRTGVFAPNKADAVVHVLDPLPIEINLGGVDFALHSIAVVQSNDDEADNVVNVGRTAHAIAANQPLPDDGMEGA